MAESDGLGKQAARGMASVASSTVVVTIVRLGALLVLARLLEPNDFGIVAAALLVATLAQIFFLRGVAPALIQKKELNTSHEHSAFVGVVLGGVIAGLLLVLVAPACAKLLNAEASTPVIRLFASLFAINAATVVPNALHRRGLQFGRLAVAEVAGTFVGYAMVSIGLAWAGFGFWALVVGNIAQSVVTLLFLWRTHPPSWPREANWKSFRELYRTSAGFSIGAFGLFISNKADAIGISRILGADALGIYTNAYRLMADPSDRLGQVFGRVLLPAMSRIQDDRKRLKDTFLDGAGTVALLTLPVGITGALIADEIIQVLLGDSWAEAAGPFSVLALTMSLRTSFRLSEALVGATGAVFRRAWRQWAFAVLVIGGVVVGSRWKLTGVAAGVSLAMVFNWFLMAQLALGEVNATWLELWKSHVPAIRTAVLASLAALALSSVLPTGVHPAVVVLGAFGAMGTVMAVLAFGAPSYFSTRGLRRLTMALRP